MQGCSNFCIQHWIRAFLRPWENTKLYTLDWCFICILQWYQDEVADIKEKQNWLYLGEHVFCTKEEVKAVQYYAL